MLIFQFHHFVKPECVEAYKAAILENVRQTVLEEGVLRVEVLQDKKDPAHFCLFEVYRDEQARAIHLETEYFKKFRQTVTENDMFARRGQGDEFEALFPESAAWK
jgi:autoinducer 2-degrading protein